MLKPILFELEQEFYPLISKRETGHSINITIQKGIYFSILGNKQKSESENSENFNHPFLDNSELINKEKFFGQNSYNSLPEEINKIQTFTDDIQNELNSKSSKKYNHIKKLKYFETKISINKRNNFNSKENNEIKTLKNNKIVYMNKYLLNSYSTSRAIKKLKKINFLIRKKRSSKYRGVSKNGSKWQVLIMINNRKYYIGNYSSEELAARIYDIEAIKARGRNARTNFAYDNEQLKKIYNKKINIKCDNISEIMTQLNN